MYYSFPFFFITFWFCSPICLFFYYSFYSPFYSFIHHFYFFRVFTYLFLWYFAFYSLHFYFLFILFYFFELSKFMINLFTSTGNHFGITAVVFKCAVQIILAFWYLYNSSTLTIFWTVWKRSTTRRDLIWYVCLFCFRSLLSFCTVFYFFKCALFFYFTCGMFCVFFHWTQFISDVFHFSPEYLLSYLGL